MNVEQLRAAALAGLQARASEFLGLLSSEERELLLGAFQRADTNGNGCVERSELRSSLQPSSEDDTVDQLLITIDIDGDGEIVLEEFYAKQVVRKMAAREKQAWNTFSHFDIDADGFVDRSELARLSEAGASAESIAALLAEADADGDGKINYAEFLAWYLSPT